VPEKGKLRFMADATNPMEMYGKNEFVVQGLPHIDRKKKEKMMSCK